MKRACLAQTNSEVASIIDAGDWSGTSLGSPANWPGPLRSLLRIILAAPVPMCIWWSGELTTFYNDAFASILGPKHPKALGRSARVIWRESWQRLEPLVENILAGGASRIQLELPSARSNPAVRQCGTVLSVSPVPDEQGRIEAIICVGAEGADPIVTQDRLTLLKQIEFQRRPPCSLEDAFASIAAVIGRYSSEFGFSLIYAFDQREGWGKLVAESGMRLGPYWKQKELSLSDPSSPWPLGKLCGESGRPIFVKADARSQTRGGESWLPIPGEAALLALGAGSDRKPSAALILGIGSCERLSHGLDEFLMLLAHQVSCVIVNAQALAMRRERDESARSLTVEIAHRHQVQEQQNLLLHELNHRVKNTLVTVQAMAVQTLKGADRAARDAFIDRLFALSAQHDLLAVDNWEGASLENVVRTALYPYDPEGLPRCHIKGSPVYLGTKRALAVGMALHELAANASKFGALSNEKGQIYITWKRARDGTKLKMRWKERHGPPVWTPTTKGFGLRLVERGLGRELCGTVEMKFVPQGLVCEWDMKLA